MAAGRAIYRRDRACDPAPALCAVLDARACSTSARSTVAEPFASLFTQGMVTHETYAGSAPGAARRIFFAPAEVDRTADGATLKADGAPVEIGRVDQDVQVEEERRRPRRDRRPLRRRCGALVHAVRQPARARPAVVGSRDRRLLALRPAAVALVLGQYDASAAGEDKALDSQDAPDDRCRVPTISRRLAFNKAVARIYELTGAIEKAAPSASRSDAIHSLLAAAGRPMMPHLAEEVWARMGRDRPDRRCAVARCRSGAAGR